MTTTKTKKLPFPPKWGKIPAQKKGLFNIINEKGNIIFENQKDTNAIRRLCWTVFNNEI